MKGAIIHDYLISQLAAAKTGGGFTCPMNKCVFTPTGRRPAAARFGSGPASAATRAARGRGWRPAT